jgi:hypothetical protein
MWEPLVQDWMYYELANLGYSYFAHDRGGIPTYTPARFLALPLMERDWLIEKMRSRGRQNRLGFLVDLGS